MALTANLPLANPKGGTYGTHFKPITDGQKVTVIPTKEHKMSIWSALDGISSTVVNGVSSIAGAAVDKEVRRLNTGAEASGTSFGDPDDNPGAIKVEHKENFVDKYKTELIIGAAAVAGLVVFVAIVRK